MATQHRHQLSRLSIPPSLQSQQPTTFDGHNMYSPALPTALQHSFMPPLAMNNSATMQTPMQPSFFPPGPTRPPHVGHRAYASIAQLAAAGIRPPPNMPMTPMGPMTPLGQNQFPPHVIGTSPAFGGQPFVPKSRRTPSLGGPPKAPLGGPGRKLSPLPPAVTPPVSNPEKAKVKKVVIKVPVETEPSSDAEPPVILSLWARTPLHPSLLPVQVDIQPPDIITAEPHPEDSSRNPLPSTVDVFLPGKSAWEEMKRRIIEEKLQKLGVEKGTGSAQNFPEILAPHARAASISSPADPALLFYKLNKLQQSQNASLSNSLSTSPQPPYLSISPHQQFPPRFQNRHGYSMSLAQPPMSQPPIYSPNSGYNPYETTSDPLLEQVSHNDADQRDAVPLNGVYAPQGRVPVPVASLNIPSAPSRADSRPDFIRGFGLDIPEEEEEFEEADAPPEERDEILSEPKVDLTASEYTTKMVQEHDAVPADKTAVHTRHASRVSVALSLGSVNRTAGDVAVSEKKDPDDGSVHEDEYDQLSDKDVVRDPDMDQDAVGEWTGSEDLRSTAEVSDDESIGEWSNPSDEERARQDRAHRRVLRRAQQELEIPRRLPNFPRPPDAPFVPVHQDDDIISNPSEEEGAQQPFGSRLGVDNDNQQYYRPSSNSSGRASRPLPPLPHSRNDSGHFSYHDPALAHSRGNSTQFAYPTSRPDSSGHNVPTSMPVPKRDSLNPNAKPFVFGSRPSGSWGPGSFGGSAATSSQHASSPGHSRLPSLGTTRALNAAAQEFKPAGFTFRPPAGVPELTFPTPAPVLEVSRPLPTPPVNPYPVRASQGREKRQRTSADHTDSTDVEDEEITRTSMSSFRFPAGPDSPPKVRRSAPASPKQLGSRRQNSLNASAKPFTFSGFSNLLPVVPPVMPSEFKPLPQPFNSCSPDHDHGDSICTVAFGEESLSPDMPMPSVSKQKRAPIPLDFKHPVSTNMVPAGLFKNLVNTDDNERVRPSVRSRLDSRDVFEHRSRHSLDDDTVPTISHKASRGRLVTESEQQEAPANESTDLDIPNYISRSGRKSSHTPLHGSTASPRSGGFIVPPDLGRLGHIYPYERLEDTLGAKIDKLRQDLIDHNSRSDVKFISTATEDMVREAMTIFRTQLHESAAQGLDDSHIDARGEMDFELIKSIIEQGHEESRGMLKQDLSEMLQRITTLSVQEPGSSNHHLLIPFMQELKNNILEINGNILERLNHVEELFSRARTSDVDRGTLTYDLLTALAPHFAALRTEPIDYEALTGRLTQAVKPHISQLIDLASDKRETAGLIVDRILPVLQNFAVPNLALDTDSLIAQLTANINRIVGPIDAHSITEQVADLVVERMDSRLAVRDMAMNADNLMTRMTESFVPLLGRLDGLSSTVDTFTQEQKGVSSRTRELTSIHKDVTALLSDLPVRLSAATDALGAALAEAEDSSERVRRLTQIETSLSSLETSGGIMNTRTQELLSLSREVLNLLGSIPSAISGTTQSLQTTRSDILARLDETRGDAEELRKVMLANTDLQVQLVKARGAHGQARVERDNINERFISAEAERERLRAQVDELQSSAVTRAAEYAALKSRTSEQEQAMHTALERLKTSDVTAQAQQERIAELEKLNRELVLEKQQWKSKVESLEMQIDFGIRDKDAVVQALNLIQNDRDHLAAQQSHWEDLRLASQSIETLTKLIGHADTEEVAELKRARDRGKVLEGEHAALLKRFKDQETKITNIERASLTARQGLAQAQQRSSDWEKKARDFESELERVSTKLDQAEQTKNQLDADYSLARLQLDELEAEGRLSKDRERKAQEQKSALETQVAHLKAQLEEAKNALPTSTGYVKREVYSNGNISRPSSRASTAYGGVPTPRLNGKDLSTQSIAPSSPPSRSSTWDSIHAPKMFYNATPVTPKARHPHDYRAAAPSPTPSTVSVTPTEGDDGWWS